MDQLYSFPSPGSVPLKRRVMKVWLMNKRWCHGGVKVFQVSSLHAEPCNFVDSLFVDFTSRKHFLGSLESFRKHAFCEAACALRPNIKFEWMEFGDFIKRVGVWSKSYICPNYIIPNSERTTLSLNM